MPKKLKPSQAKNKLEQGDGCLKQIFGTLIGSIPLFLMMSCCGFILNKDYIAKGNNFWGQSHHFGLIEPHDYFEEVKCVDEEYEKDRRLYKNCSPKFCGRYFSDFIMNEEDTDLLLGIANKGFSYGESSGGASIFDIYNGVVSKENAFISVKNTLKSQNKKLLTDEEIKGFNKVKDKIVETIKAKFSIDNVYLTKPVFFSKITNKDAKTMHDEYWHEHVDKDQYEGFHYTTLVYLNGHQHEYMGGRFYWRNLADNTTLSHEPNKGRVSVFTSGSENKHYVEKVLSGVRYAVTIPFTCNEKLAINIE